MAADATPRCPSDLALERLLAGEPGEAKDHVAGCERCQARVAAMEAQGAQYRRTLHAVRARAAFARADHRWRSRAMIAALVPLAAAAAALGITPLLKPAMPAIPAATTSPRVEGRTPPRPVLEPRGGELPTRLRTIRLRGQPVGFGQGSLEAAPEEGRSPSGPFTLKHTDVDAQVSAFVARVQVTQEFENPFRDRVEAVYVFPLPDNAAVDDMTLVVGQRVIKGVIKRREEARRDYEEAKSQGRRAALLDEERPNIFTQSVANILPGETVKVVIRYVAQLKYDDGSFEFNFPMVVGPRYAPGAPLPGASQGGGTVPDTDRVIDASRITPPVLAPGDRSGRDIAVKLHIDAGLPMEDLISVSHRLYVDRPSTREAQVELAADDRVANKDLIVRWKVAGRELRSALMATRGAGGGYFALLVQPEGAQTHPRVVAKEMVFVIDTSGSMTGFPLAAEKRFMRQALQSMNPDDTFMLIDFADHASSFHGSPLPNTPRNVERALAYLDALPAGGGTNQLDGIRTALDRPDDQARLRTVLFMTDGFIGNDNEILAETQKLLGNARLFSFGVGTSVNHYLLSRLGEVGRGFYQYVRPDEDKAEAIERFLRRIARPLVTDVEIDWGGLTVSEVLPRKIPDLFDNQPFIVVGKYSAPGRARVVVHGKTAGVSRTTEADVELPERSDEHAAIATLWARARIEELERLQYAGEKAELIRQITSLGLEHRLVTPYTSFVAVDQVVAASPNSLLHTVNEAVEMPDQVTMGEPAVKAPPAKHEAKVTGQGHDTWTGDKPRSGGYHAAPVNTPQPGYVADPGAVSGIGGIDTSGEAKTTRSGHADDDFDKIFGSGGGGGGTQGAQPASQPRTSEKAKTVYIPPAPGWGDHANNGDLGVDGKASKERDSKVGGLIALREGLDEHKANAEIVGGAIDRTTIENVIKAHLPELQASYENSLKSNPHAGGQVVVELTIAATGLVSNAEIVSSTLRAPEVERAILKSARTWKFPAPGGGAVIVRYPFDFTPGALKDTFAESDVMEVVLAAKPALKKCIAEQKAREPAKSGTIVMRWTIKNDGTVTNVQTVTEPFQKAPLSACLESLIKGLRFYPYSGPLMSPIDFPFKF